MIVIVGVSGGLTEAQLDPLIVSTTVLVCVPAGPAGMKLGHVG